MALSPTSRISKDRTPRPRHSGGGDRRPADPVVGPRARHARVSDERACVGAMPPSSDYELGAGSAAPCPPTVQSGEARLEVPCSAAIQRTVRPYDAHGSLPFRPPHRAHARPRDRGTRPAVQPAATVVALRSFIDRCRGQRCTGATDAWPGSARGWALRAGDQRPARRGRHLLPPRGPPPSVFPSSSSRWSSRCRVRAGLKVGSP